MASTNIISINQLIKMFEDFSTAHLQINDFGYGPTSEIGVNRQSKYPLMWATHRGPSDITVTNKTQIPQLTLSFIIVDQINIQENYKDAMGLDGDNQQEILSDTFQIFQDLINYISVDMGRFGVKLMEDNISIEPLFDETQDKVTGWIGDINLQLRHSNCVSPLGDIEFTIPGTVSTSSRYLTCETLANCDTFTNAINSIEDNYVTGGTFNSLTSSIDFTGANSFTPFSVTGISSDNYYTTGATYSEPDVTFTRNDGGTYQLDLSPLVERVKNNEDDISNITAQIILNKTNIDDNSTAIDTLGVIVDTKISCDDLSGCTTITDIQDDVAVQGETLASLTYSVNYLPENHIWIGDTGNTRQAVELTGDVLTNWSGVTTIQPDSVTYDKMQDVTSKSVLGSTATSGGTVEEIPMIDEWLTTGAVTALLENTSNWSGAGQYTGTIITGTYQSQKHADSSYLFIAKDDNDWIRVARI